MVENFGDDLNVPSMKSTSMELRKYNVNICWERKQFGRAHFMNVPANVQYVFVSDSIQILDL